MKQPLEESGKGEEVTLESLSDELKKMRQKIGTTEQVALKAVKKSSEQLRKQAEMNEILTGETLTKAKNEVAELHRVYGLAFLKMSAATETVFMLRINQKTMPLAHKAAVGALKAFDLEDEWWTSKKDYTLLKWSEVFLNIYDNGLPDINPEIPVLMGEAVG